MPETTYKFNSPEGQTIARELLIAYLNVGTAEEPDWAAIGKRVEESSAEYDFGSSTTRDVLGNVFTTLQKPTITQSFDPLPLDSSDKAAQKIWEIAVYKQDVQALANQDMVIAHWYTDANGVETNHFAERYSSCAIPVSSLGGPGGGNVEMPIEITYGGERTLGHVTKEGDKVTFAPDDSE